LTLVIPVADDVQKEIYIMQQSMRKIEQEFQIWRGGKARANEDIPQRLWALACEHIELYGEDEVAHLARRLGVPWARLRGKWLKWQEASQKIPSEFGQTKQTIASKVPVIEPVETMDASSIQEDTRRLANNPRARRFVQGRSAAKKTTKIKRDGDPVLHITRISIPQNLAGEVQSNQEYSHLPNIHRPVYAQISSGKVLMEIGPGMSPFAIADIFVSISMRMKKEGDCDGLASISSN
jgi:hypothetical protein